MSKWFQRPAFKAAVILGGAFTDTAVWAQFGGAPMLSFPSDSLERAVSGFVPVDSTAIEQRYKILEQHFDPSKRQYSWRLERKEKKAADATMESFTAEFVNGDGIVLYKALILFSASGEGDDSFVAVTQSVPPLESMGSYRQMRVARY